MNQDRFWMNPSDTAHPFSSVRAYLHEHLNVQWVVLTLNEGVIYGAPGQAVRLTAGEAHDLGLALINLSEKMA